MAGQPSQLSRIDRLETRVIHLARSTVRHAIISRELAKAGVQGALFAAVDGRDPAEAARLAEVPDHGPWGALDAHAKGCLLSHLDAMAGFVAGEASHLLVLEDDVFLSEDLAPWLQAEVWPADADLIKLEGWRDDRLRLLVARRGPVARGRALRRLYSKHSGTAGYLISRQGARKVLAAPRQGLAVDHLLFNPAISSLARALAVYQVFPAMVLQGNENGRTPFSPLPPPGPRPRRSLRHRLTRGLAELQALRLLPLLARGRTEFLPIAWRALPSDRAPACARPELKE
jgi:glycosyl transferase family 25